MSSLGTRIHGRAISILFMAGLMVPATAVAAAERTYRYEESANADWTVVQTCADGSTSTTFLQVIGGLESESKDLDDADEFVTVRVLNFETCDGEFVNDRGTGSAEYSGSPSLREASVSGSITLRSGAVAVVDLMWQATGRLETTVNQTHFPGFTGVFRGREREAIATGTVTIDGIGLVGGPSDGGGIESLEDRNIATP